MPERFAFFLVARGNVGTDGIGHIDDGHGLEPDFAGARENGVKEPFAAEKDIFDAGDFLNINGNGGIESRHIPGIHNDFLARFQLVLHQIAVDFNKGGAVAGELLHNEAFTAEKARADFFIFFSKAIDFPGFFHYNGQGIKF